MNLPIRLVRRSIDCLSSLRVVSYAIIPLIFVLVATGANAQEQNSLPVVSKLTPTANPTPEPVKSDNAKSEETKLTDRERALLERVDQLERRLAEVEGLLKKPVAETDATAKVAPNSVVAPQPAAAHATPVSEEKIKLPERGQGGNAKTEPPIEVADVAAATQAEKEIAEQQSPKLTKEDRSLLDSLHGTTINVVLDGYYGFNYNRPIGRVNVLRAYDVLSNAFSLNQAAFIFEKAPNPEAGSRSGGRIDLQFGQATETLQGNPFNEPRPQVYRHIFQAYGTYVAPVAKGLTLDVGKWASSLGMEGNYAKDQMNYSRSYWFNFLPFYHMGVRANLKVNDRVAFNYWLTNGTQQTEPFKSFKDQMLGTVLQPGKNINWTINYYLGQEHPDITPIPNPGPQPLQPGLSFTPIRPSPDGRLHIFDTYLTWQATPKLTLAFEGDYVIQRLWRHDAPGRPSMPAHVNGGSAYVRYQLTPKVALAARGEYLSDSGGMFSGVTQALKENTLTLDYKPSPEDGFLLRFEWRRDFSNQPYFFTQDPGVFKKDQNTTTVGLVWWWGRKTGSW